ncbi:MAG TPA: HDIG domain-containing protein [Gemmataceae bacterium]|nr:HDIG domain-containing protein [Gemmataceae bacterium]
MLGSSKKQPRLGQWDGRRHSTRHGAPLLARLTQPHVLLRLLPVLVTVLLATLLVYSSGPPLPYRYGEVCERDIRSRLFFEVVDEAQTELRREKAVDDLPAERREDPAACEAARQDVPPVMRPYPLGSPLVQRGQPIRREQLTLLDEEHRAFRRSRDHLDHLARGGALFLIHGLLASLVVLYVVRFQKGLAQSLSKIAGVCILVLLTFALAIVMSRSPWYAVLIPLTVTALVLTIVYNPPFALLLSLTLSLATTVALGGNLHNLLVQMAGLATAVLSLRGLRTRTRLVKVGLGAGVVYLLMTVGTGILAEQMWWFVAFDAVRALVWGTLAGFLVSGCLPLVERCFSIVTDITLLELADGSHPLQQELIRRAPGTYTHSMTVATLAEPAAEAIGADPLLTRVGAYFHDVGKMLKPDYFVENQSGENRHEGLEPALSTLVIIGHVKDGLALAEQYRLPRPIIDFIQQHHGTTLVEYFYREALRLQESQGNGHVELEPAFRYPGPKPGNRENGIVMLADAVESSSRALTDPTPGSLRKLVHDLLMKRLLDGQFDESGLTLTELHVVEETLSKGLIALYHSRIKYPEAKERGPALLRERETA